MLLNALQAILIAGWIALSTQSTANNRTIVALTVQNTTTGLIQTAGELGDQNAGLQVSTDLGIVYAKSTVFDPDTAATFVPVGPVLSVDLSNLRAAAKVRQAKINPPEKSSKAVNARIQMRPGYIRLKAGAASKGAYAFGDGYIYGVAMVAIDASDLLPSFPSEAAIAVTRRLPKESDILPDSPEFLGSTMSRLAYQQAAAESTVASIRMILDGSIPPPDDSGRRRKVANISPPSGTFYIGADSSSFSGNLTTCKLLPPDVSSNWDMYLDNIIYNNSPLGYNGVVTVASSQFWSAVPQSFFNLVVGLLNRPGGVVNSGSAWRTYDFPCAPDSYAVGLPNITYVAGGQPLVFTPYQYIYADKVGSQCYLSFAVNLDGTIPFPYTISTTLLNGTYTEFDPLKQTFSYGISS